MSNHNNISSKPFPGWKGEDDEENQSTLTLFHDVALTLEQLHIMFRNQIDSDVIEMIWQESNEDGNAALEMLSGMCPQISSPLPDPVEASGITWSSMLTNNSKPFTAPPSPPSIPKKFEVAGSKTIVSDFKERIQRKERILIIMRGVPGSGKSHLAYQLKGNGSVLSTDDFFINHRGQYAFNPTRLPEAHDWNKRRADREMKARVNPIIVDNTNLEAWEMQPYIYLALRYNYTPELVEPDTPWKEDARILSKKNAHRVPIEKIQNMLEKKKIPINFELCVENCRKSMIRNKEIPATKMQSNRPIGNNSKQNGHHELIDVKPKITLPTPKPEENIANLEKNSAPEIFDNVKPIKTLLKWDPGPWQEAVIPATPSPDVMAPSTSNGELTFQWDNKEERFNSCEVGIQTSMSDPALTTLIARNRSINHSSTAPQFEISKVNARATFDKGCNTEEVVEDLATRKALSILKSYFPEMDVKDLADVLDKCNGDLSWTVNLLLDSGYECAVDETANQFDENYFAEFDAEPPPSSAAISENNDEAVSCTSSSEMSSTHGPIVPDEETEALRKHVEDCFHLTDTISDQTRRICGKDYHQFRASQLQKLRSGNLPADLNIPPAAATSDDQNSFLFNPSGEDGAVGGDLLPPVPGSPISTEEESKASDDSEAAVPMTLDPTFVQQLVSLFGAPDLKKNGSTFNPQKGPVSFDIPWSLAEQIYLHWCSSLISDDDSSQLDESAELRDIMDIEFAMQLVQEEKNAERRELRESLATKLSSQMLRENYPLVDPLALDALFEANNFNYSHTVTALNASLGTKPKLQPIKPIAAPKEESATNEEMVKQQVGPIDYRSEANMYNRLRQEFGAKAQENHRRGMYSVATYYASESRRYGDLYNEAHQKAALKIVEEKNARQDERTIDLHELRVTEALSYLESFIAENVKDGKTVIQVITGKGNHSINGRPRIKPAVITFLKKKKYGLEEINPGMLRVYLRRTPRRI